MSEGELTLANTVEIEQSHAQKVNINATDISGIPISLTNPVHHCVTIEGDADYTDWSYVYFGSYPQSEVIGDELTTAIIKANYDDNGDAWVKGKKYRRICTDSGYSNYKYFRWERIKWKVNLYF